MENLKSPPPYSTDQEQPRNDRKLAEFNDDEDDSDDDEDDNKDPNSCYSNLKNAAINFLKNLWNKVTLSF